MTALLLEALVPLAIAAYAGYRCTPTADTYTPRHLREAIE